MFFEILITLRLSSIMYGGSNGSPAELHTESPLMSVSATFWNCSE
jgi:hypothetical protein